MRAFEFLHHDVKRAVWDLGWESLRKIQNDAIHHLYTNPSDMIISAPTSSGKTEAAILPILSLERDALSRELKVLYVGPLKALINDQFSRICKLCFKMDITITKWHGDANAARKRKLCKSPSGILLITPESLESLLINREIEAKRIFKNLSYIIIDEVHAFAGYSRGDQLRCLINRVGILNSITCIKIALSATIGSLGVIAKWMCSHNPICIIEDQADRSSNGSIRIYEQKYIESEIEKQTRSGKKILFANSKRKVEEYCLKSKDQSSHPDRIGIHHGSLDRTQREQVEMEFRTASLFSVFCTNTLELGIDVGDVDEVVLLDPPWSVSSFVQKIGRSGRTHEKDISFNFSLSKKPMSVEIHLMDHINWALVRSIALIELLRDGWCEEGMCLSSGYSTMVHQIIAYVAQKRVVRVLELYEQIVVNSFDSKISKVQFQQLLCHFGVNDIFAQDRIGEVSLGRRGERLTENYDFLSVFDSPKEWSVVTCGAAVGTIPLANLFQVGDRLILGGDSWSVIDINYKSLVLTVAPASGGYVPRFAGDIGCTHPMIHQKMEQIINGNQDYFYLYPDAKSELEKSRGKFKSLVFSNQFLPIFSGTQVTNTIAEILKSCGYDYINYDFGIMLNENINECFKGIGEIESIISEAISATTDRLCIEKHDYLLPKDLLKQSIISQMYDLKGASEWITKYESKNG